MTSAPRNLVAYWLRRFMIGMIETLSAERKVSAMAENIFAIMNGDTSTTQQFLDTFRRSEHLEPERALIAAILEDAAHEYRKYKGARGPEGKERFRAAQRWIMGNRDDWIFAFNNVCELLGLNPDYVRRGLRGAKGKEGTTRHHHGARRRAA